MVETDPRPPPYKPGIPRDSWLAYWIGMHLRRLLIDELLVRDWIRDNRRAIESTKAYWTNKQSPPQVQVMLVLQECRSNTWARISYSDSAELNNIKVALVQDSPNAAAQWTCLHGSMNEGLNPPQLVRNVQVYYPISLLVRTI